MHFFSRNGNRPRHFIFAAILALAAVSSPAPAIDPSVLQSLTPEQQQRALEALSKGSAEQQDKPLSQPAVVQPQAPPPARTESGELKPFGYELFSGVPSTFAPVTEIPVPQNYILGPGDNIRVQLFGAENAEYRLVVSRDGSVNIPKFGPIYAAGLSFDRFRAALEERVATQMIGVKASVSLGELRSIRVFILGEANQPGSYSVSSLSTITNALFVSGGIQLNGSLRDIQLKRNGRTVQKLDLYDLLLRGDTRADARLQPGDVIFIPPVGGRVGVGGEVRRPALYELAGEKTVADALELAGGLLATTDVSTAQIERVEEQSHRTLLTLNLASPEDRATQVRDGDVLRVQPVANRIRDIVALKGFVQRPANYPLTPGLTVGGLLKAAQGILKGPQQEAYLLTGLLIRSDVQTGLRRPELFNLHDILFKDAPGPTLNPDDAVVIFSREEIAYLSSEQVYNVLFGLKSAAPKQEGVTTSAAESFGLAGTHTGQTAPATSPPELQENVIATGENCRGLAELAEIVNTQRAFRMALSLVSQGARPELRVRRTFNCPAIFDQEPKALPILLEYAVAVQGEVREPGLYPVAAGASMAQVIEAAGGMSGDADTSNIEYLSYLGSSEQSSTQVQTLSVGTLDRPAAPSDVLTVRSRPSQQESGTVLLSGEFRFPGAYTIARGERLSQLIQRAGGLTEQAYPYGAVFARESAKRAEIVAYRRAAADIQEALTTAITSGAYTGQSAGGGEILSALIRRLETAEPVGRVVMEADPAVLQARPELDLVLEAGDALHMPKRSATVTVAGQVLNAGTLAFNSGADADDYISQAGGLGESADDDRIFVVFPNGAATALKTSFWNFTTTKIPPGSTIVVPRDLTPINALVLTERVSQIFSNLAISAAALITISR